MTRKRSRPSITAEQLVGIAPPEAFDNTPRATLTLTRDTIWLTRHDDRGAAISTYPINAKDVAGVFNDFGADTGMLPPDVLFWQMRGTEPRIGVYVPPARRTIRYAAGRRELKLAIPAPGLVFVGQGHQYLVYAALARPLTVKDQLYRAPFSNVYPGGAICTGDVQVPAATVGTMAQFVQLWWDSVFTDHISGGRVNDKRPLFKFLQSLAHTRRFPKSALIPERLMGHVLGGDHAWNAVTVDARPARPDPDLERERTIDEFYGPLDGDDEGAYDEPE